MRVAYLLLIVTVPLGSGCSVLIATTGQDLQCMNTKTEVRAQMGEPSKSGVEDGKAFDEYRTRRKISEDGTDKVCGMGMAFAMTFGTSEIVAFPYELYLAGSRTLVGQDVRLVYDPKGNVIERLLDGHSLRYLTGIERSPVDSSPAASENSSTGPPPAPP